LVGLDLRTKIVWRAKGTMGGGAWGKVNNGPKKNEVKLWERRAMHLEG